MRKFVFLLLCVSQGILWPAKTITSQKGEALPATRSSASPSRLLFTYVTSNSGFDTEITLSNTSQDTVGSTPQAGTCTLNFYGSGTVPPAGTTVSIAAGKQIVFALSQGGGGIAASPNFTGYIAATCDFRLARGSRKVYAAGHLATMQDAQIIATPRSTANSQRVLLPFVTNQAGFDTPLAIANTSLDPFGTAPTSGTCTLNFYGQNPPPPVTTPTIGAGGVYLNILSLLAPNFQGYIIANCGFTGAAATVLVSDAGARAVMLEEPGELLTLPRGTTVSPLLFSTLTNQSGSDTGIAIANTTLDPFGTAAAAGACTLNFYGANAPGPVVTPNIAAGATYVSLMSLLAPGFRGYLIATCPFAHARGFAFTGPLGLVSDGGSEIPEAVVTPRSITPAPLLFSSVTNWNGADTTITVSNTSQDPLGTAQASGTCTVNYFGEMAGGGSLPSPQTSSTIAAGSQLTFTLSQGNAAQNIGATPGFRGYVIVGCTFPLARGVATVTTQVPALSITKTHTGGFTQGQSNATYTVTVSNGAAAGSTSGTVTVTDTLPAKLTLVSMAGTGWTCVNNACSRTDPLNPGASYPAITVTVSVAADATTPQVNSVTVAGGGSANATATDSTAILNPAISALVNGASNLVTALSPGGVMTIFGTNLSASNTQCFAGGVAPTVCNGTSVLVNGNPVPLIFVSPGQVNFVTPWGLAGASATVQVNNQGELSNTITRAIAATAPGLTTGNAIGTFLSSSFVQITAANPAHGGDNLITFAFGLGSTSPAVADGVATPGSGLYSANAAVGITVGAVPATVGFAGLSPGQIGLFQINFTVPNGLYGNQPVVLTAGGVNSNSVVLPLALQPSALSIAKTHVGSFAQGQSNAGYTVTVSNGAAAGATSGTVTVTETIPSGLTLVSMSGAGWTCPVAGTTCTRSDSLPSPGAYPPITVLVNVAANASSPQVNAVAVSGGNSPTANTTDSTTILSAFTDASPSDFYYNAVNLMREYSITAGCSANPPMYCPNDNVTRAQMAIFVVRSVMGGDNFSYASSPHFSDVPAGAFGYQWIQKMFELGITSGCGNNNYCPNDPVTRGQMAIFVIRARLGTAADATFTFPSTPYFTDADASHPYFKWIQRMRLDGITAGCGGTSYCPNDPVTRGQMAIFIMRGAFNQLLPAGTPLVSSAVPAVLNLGQATVVTVTGTNTNFLQGTTQVNAGAGVTTGTITVSSPTSLTVQLTAAATTAGPRTIVVTTGTEQAVLPNGLTVQ